MCILFSSFVLTSSTSAFSRTMLISITTLNQSMYETSPLRNQTAIMCEVFSCTLPSVLLDHAQWQVLVQLYKKHCKRSSELTTDVNIWWWLSINYAEFASFHFIPVIRGFITSIKIILKWSFSVIKENYIMLANTR